MIYKRLIFTLIFLIGFLRHSDAIRRGGSSKSRIGSHSYSSANLSNESPSDPGRAILGILFMVLSCGGGIGWKIYKCYQKEKRRKFLPPSPLPYPNNIYTTSTLTPAVEQFNETDLLSKRSTFISLTVESLGQTPEKLIQENTLERIHVQQTNSSILVPAEEINKSARTSWINTLL